MVHYPILLATGTDSLSTKGLSPIYQSTYCIAQPLVLFCTLDYAERLGLRDQDGFKVC